MLNKYTHKQKFIGFLVLGAILFVMLYIKLVQPTVVLLNANRTMAYQLEQLTSYPLQIKQLEAQLNNQKKQLILKSDKPAYDQLLEIINRFNSQNKIELVALVTPHEYQSNDYQLVTVKVTVGGKFQDLVRLGKFIEDRLKIVKVVAASYYTVVKPATDEKKLFCEYYVQYVKI